MPDLALKILDRYGFPTLVAVALGALLVWQMQDSKKERLEQWQTMMQYVMDCRK